MPIKETTSDQLKIQKVTNMFDNLAALAPSKPADLGSELDCYLSTDVEHVANPIAWWYEHHGTYPCLSRMALNYLTIPAVDVFSFCTSAPASLLNQLVLSFALAYGAS
ncbi:hypothetical protein PAXRUDRAFT_13465 [Paxillus rubicundulus Ve08.2h10]|uniref:HAT C-terminal dimerisation domain-containing protein n=1 Tax=Paxillus rubicundulus Ve08.2h10 TaxID=930991 RepID=A0A0D0DTQ4_9AGAM|nr:hypothetical protein PAXRUDRAFT_13465 [Paxillus rubicundulus Ve08.2h10]